MKILSIFGTRSEAIKMAPVMRALNVCRGVTSVICVTDQHRRTLEQLLDLFNLCPDYDLDVTLPDQSRNDLCSRLFCALGPVLEQERPDRVLVHGATATATIGAMAAFHQRIAVAHVEAGLRSGNPNQSWPAETQRRLVDVMSDYLFAPTAGAADNLRHDNLDGQIIVTGNTAIDALHFAADRIAADADLRSQLDARFPFLHNGRKMLLVTGHRRENFGAGFADICQALAQLATRPDIDIVYPRHLNRHVRGPLHDVLSPHNNVHLIEPLDYLHSLRLMQHAHVILTDSGSIQEAAPALGKPVLVMRDVTERPEAVASGTVQLIGTESARIVAAVTELFDQPHMHSSFSHHHNPYGDGHAAQRIVAALTGMPYSQFQSPRNALFKQPDLHDQTTT